jgi:septum site-determining protein MinC
MDGSSNRGRQAFRIKGTMPALTMLCLLTEDIEAIERQLVEHLSQMPQFFLHAPVVVDLDALGDTRVDLARLGELLRRHRLVPVAVREPSEVQRERAIAAGWGLLQNTSAPAKRPSAARREREEEQSPLDDVEVVAQPAPAAPKRTGAKTEGVPPQNPSEPQLAGLSIRMPVRSGQVIYAVGGDLVVLAAVSSGAELIADGNIHVYAPLRGRAYAGAHDNAEASIFCMSLEAEFLSVAGHYLLAEEIPKDHRGKPARVHLKDGELVVTRL